MNDSILVLELGNTFLGRLYESYMTYLLYGDWACRHEAYCAFFIEEQLSYKLSFVGIISHLEREHDEREKF